MAIAQKKAARQQQQQHQQHQQPKAPPTPTRVRKSRTTPSSLPNMFEQKERREREFEKSRREAGRPHVPMDKKVLGNVLDRFEDQVKLQFPVK